VKFFGKQDELVQALCVHSVVVCPLCLPMASAPNFARTSSSA